MTKSKIIKKAAQSHRISAKETWNSPKSIHKMNQIYF